VEKRVIIAVVLSMFVAIFWQKFMVSFYPAATNTAPVNQPSNTAIVENQTIKENKIIESPKIEEEKTFFETNRFLITLSNIGGCIKKIELKDYRDSANKELYSIMASEMPGRGVFSLYSDKLSLTQDILKYDVKKYANSIECSTLLPQGIKIIKRYNFTENDTINIDLEFENTSSQLQIFDYEVIGGVDIECKNNIDKQYVEASAKVGSKIHRDKNAKGKDGLLHAGETQWAGVTNKFFVMILKPKSLANAGIVREYNDKVIAAGISMNEIAIEPGAKAINTFLLYAGPKNTKRLASLGVGLEEVITYGIFGSISEVLLYIIRGVYKVTHNWGLAIIILSLAINICLYPLTNKSLQSMRKLQALQPQIKQLQDKYSKNPQKLNKEIMSLYKEQKVNPLGGCLPMLLQMPIFIALYQGLIYFVELKNSKFLWISDLSAPDVVRLGSASIHLLPILMAITMFFQQKFSHPQSQAGMTEQQLQQQKMMAVMMPIMFGFIFYKFPSGLVLYWFTNTIVMTASQIFMLRKANR